MLLITFPDEGPLETLGSQGDLTRMRLSSSVAGLLASAAALTLQPTNQKSCTLD